MYAWIKGKIIRKGKNFSIVTTDSGVGYAVFMSNKDLDSLTANSEVELNLFHHIRENKEELYGFVDLNDVLYFERLLTVSGVGPTTALDIMNNYLFEEFVTLIEAGDVSKLCAVKGVGKKGAQRIIVELAGKLVTIDSTGTDNEKITELKNAMKSLGFGEYEINKMIKNIDINKLLNDSVEELIKTCLSNV